MLEVTERNADRLTVLARGTLSHADYVRLVPQLESAIEANGSLRLMVVLDDFHGWQPGAWFDELRFDLKHRRDFERIAVVGSGKIEAFGTKLTQPFFSGQVRFFEDADEARDWLDGKTSD